MRVHQNVQDGYLYTLKWVQERVGDPVVIYALGQGHMGKTIRHADRMDFVTLSPEALRRPAISPVAGSTGASGMDE